jgi:hypothetical protein
MDAIFPTNGHSSDEAIDSLYSFWPGTAPAALPCPEALFSVTIRGKLNGQETLLTVRGMSSEEFTRNLQAVKGLLDPVSPPTPAQASTQGQGKDFCQKHQVAMQRHENAKGVWYSHFVDGVHCKGR